MTSERRAVRASFLRSTAGTLALMLLWASAWTAALAWGAQRTAPEDTRGVLRVEGRTAREFGLLDRDADASTEFVIRNTSRSATSIARFWTSCGCTLLEVPEGTLPPGGEVHLRVKLDTSQPGRKSSEIFLQQEGESEMKVGSVSFAVRSGWSIGANPVSLRIPTGGAPPTQIPVCLVADSDVDAPSVAIRSDLPGLELRHVLDGRVLRITPVIDPASLPRGEYLHLVHIVSSLRNGRDFPLGFAVVHGADSFRTIPRTLRVPFGCTDTEVQLKFHVESGERRAIVSSVRSLDPEVPVEMLPGSEGSDCVIRLHVPADRLLSRKVPILLETDIGPLMTHVLVPSQETK